MIIQLQDGTSFDIADYNLKRLFHRIPSPDIQHNFSSVDGRSDIITESKLNNRIISVELLYQAYDIYDYYNIRDQLNEIFARNEWFYITFKKEPYKRWKVRLANQFDTEPSPAMKTFVIEFITENIYAESNFSTLQFKKEWDVDQHAWNGKIDWDGSSPAYTFSTNEFVVKNLGDKIIDPREDEIEIILKGNFENFVRIKNMSTGQTYEYNRSLLSTNELRLSGVRTFRDGVSDFVNTNKKLINLAIGENAIIIEGGTVNSISFDFRYLYK